MTLRLSIVFFYPMTAGFIFQLTGIFSITAFAVISSYALLLVFFLNYLMNGNAITSKASIFFLLCVLYILANGIFHQVSIKLILVYLYFVTIPYCVFTYLKYLEGKYYSITIHLYSILKWIALLQLPIILVERIFSESIISFSRMPIRYEDIGFGSFFMANDHALGFFLLIMLILHNDFKPLSKNRNLNVLISLYICLTVLIANSQITILLLFVYLFYKLWCRNKYMAFMLMAILLYFGYFIVSSYDFLIVKRLLLNTSLPDLEKIRIFIQNNKSSRLQEVLFFIVSPIDLFGNGAFSKFNIEKGVFNFGTNFSQLLWNYYDLGLAGVILVYSFFFYLLKNILNGRYLVLFGCLFCIYSFFSNVTNEVAFTFVFLFFPYFISQSSSMQKLSLKSLSESKTTDTSLN